MVLVEGHPLPWYTISNLHTSFFVSLFNVTPLVHSLCVSIVHLRSYDYEKYV
jgi:hypothetical protein